MAGEPPVKPAGAVAGGPSSLVVRRWSFRPSSHINPAGATRDSCGCTTPGQRRSAHLTIVAPVAASTEFPDSAFPSPCHCDTPVLPIGRRSVPRRPPRPPTDFWLPLGPARTPRMRTSVAPLPLPRRRQLAPHRPHPHTQPSPSPFPVPQRARPGASSSCTFPSATAQKPAAARGDRRRPPPFLRRSRS